MRLKTRIVALLAIAMLSLGLATGGAIAEESDTTVITTTVTLEGPPPSGMCTVSVPGGDSVAYTTMVKAESGYTDGEATINLTLGQTILPESTVPCNLAFTVTDLESETEDGTGEPFAKLSRRHMVVQFFNNPASGTPSFTTSLSDNSIGATVRMNSSTASSQDAKMVITIKGAEVVVPPDTYTGTVTFTASQGN